MRLADFIEANSDAILTEWVAFAETCDPSGGHMDLAALRDHAMEMLQWIIDDLRTPQTRAEQARKAKGRADPDEAMDTAPQVHGASRAESGFSVGQMVSEYRALRASVIRLWTRSAGGLTGDDLEDLMRFNEAIDQALAGSIARYANDIGNAKEMFVAILGHDLRMPLGAVNMAAQYMLAKGKLEGPSLRLAERILRSARRMNQMVGELLDFACSRLGSGIPIVRTRLDLATELAHAVEEVTAAHPESLIELTTSGDLRGSWDGARIGQVLANLLGNAVQHGTARTPITVTARGAAKEVTLHVHNLGPPIPASARPGLFSPFKRLRSGGKPSPEGRLGLGLHIAESIVLAHGGRIELRSAEGAGTTFIVHLPRDGAGAARPLPPPRRLPL